MWGTLLALALLLTVNPVRLGIILLVLTRPRPMQNLFAYWAGTLLAGLAYLLVPLVLLHSTPAMASFAQGFVVSDPEPGVRYAVIGLGVVLVAIAAMMGVRLLARARTLTKAPAGAGATSEQGGATRTSTLTLDPSTLPIISRLVRPAPDVLPEGGSRTQRLIRRARAAWQNGSPWIAFVIGLMVMPADGVLLALALIVASGAALGTQLAAAVVFVITVLAVEEIILVSNLLAPEKTHAVVRRLHQWAKAHHRKFMAAILALVGVSLVLQGLGGL